MDQGAQNKENGLGLDSVIQSALAAGIPIPQVIQFIQSSFQTNQLQSFAQTPSQQLLAVVTNPAQQLLSASNASNVSGLGHLNVHSNLNFNLSALTQPQHQVHVASSQAPQSSLNSTINGAENGSLPWPIFQPAVHVPHFDMSTYQKVNLDAQASALPSGMDLPLHDMNTLRFFFNFGVHHARQILLREHFQLQPGQPQQQPTNSASVAPQLGQQGQLMSSLSNQDLLYQQMLLKNGQDMVSGKPVGTPLPGSTSAVTDPRSAFQLQKDLANSLLNKSQGLQIKNEPMENLLIHNSLLGAASAARGVNTSAPQSTPLAILQRQQQAQQGHQSHNQQRSQNQEPEVLRPQPVSLSDLTGSVQIQQLFQQQNLGGIGLSFQQNKALTAQVPVDPAPRQSVPSRDQAAGGAFLTTSAGSTFAQKDVQDQADRMKPTAIVRGAVADVASRSQNSPPKGSEASSTSQSHNTQASNGMTLQSTSMSSSQDTAAVAVANALVSQFGGVNGQVPSLAAQLSAAMVASTFMNPSKLPVSSSANSNPLANDNPDAHLLAGTSPYAKFPALAQSATRSLTSGNSGLTSEASHANTSEISISDIKPDSILQTSEQHFTEAFKRSLQQQMHGKNGKGSPKNEQADSPDRVQRKSGVNLLNVEKEGGEKKKSSEKPIPSMINYVNSCLTQIKSQVQSQGVGLPIDHNGRPIDYSSRPIDPIFRQAREKLDKDRDFSLIRRGSPSLHPPSSTESPVDSCPIGISDLRSRSEQPQDIQQKVATLSPANSQRPRSTQPGAEGALENNNGAGDGPSESKRIKIDSSESP